MIGAGIIFKFLLKVRFSDGAHLFDPSLEPWVDRFSQWFIIFGIVILSVDTLFILIVGFIGTIKDWCRSRKRRKNTNPRQPPGNVNAQNFVAVLD